MVLKPISGAGNKIDKGTMVENSYNFPAAGLAYFVKRISGIVIKMVWKVECIPALFENFEFQGTGVRN